MAEEPALQASDVISKKRQVPLGELALFFLRLGTTAFGGPAAHIAIMEDELVRRRQWLSREKFLDLLGASNLIPGPSSSEVAIHIGYLCAGWKGLLIAGSCFILPAALIVAGLGWLYVHFGKLPAVAGVLYGIKPVVIAVVLQALWSLGRTAVKTTFLGLVAVLALVLSVIGLHPLLLLLLAGGVACVPALRTSRVSLSVLPFLTIGGGILATTASFSLVSLFLVCLKLGATVFGSGYVLLAFLRADLVTHRGWLTDAACRCCCCGSNDARTSVHDRHFYRLYPRGNSWCRCRDGRYLPPGVCTSSGQWSTGAAHSKIEDRGRFS